MEGRYYIGAYWGPRRESVEQSAAAMVSFLKGLSDIDPIFSQWFQTAPTRKKALAREVHLSDENLRERLLAGRNRRDLDKRVIEDLGFNMRLWTGDDDDEAGVLTLHCGSYSARPLGNCLVIDAPSSGAGARRYLQSQPVSKTLALVANVWKPSWAVCTSGEFRDELERITGKPRRGPFPPPYRGRT